MQDMVVDAKQELHERRFHRHSELVSYPEKWDWREKSFVTDVRKQKESGSIYTQKGNLEMFDGTKQWGPVKECILVFCTFTLPHPLNPFRSVTAHYSFCYTRSVTRGDAELAGHSRQRVPWKASTQRAAGSWWPSVHSSSLTAPGNTGVRAAMVEVRLRHFPT